MSKSKKENLAIIGASYLQLPLIEKAKQMGFATHVFAWAANDVGETAADFFYPVSIVEKDRILGICREIGICGICSIASDLAAVTVNYVAEKMNLPGNGMETALRSTNKHLMRLAFEENGDPSPLSVLVDENTDIESLHLRYPVIVKPTDRSGSRGITKVESGKDLASALSLAFENGFEKKALIEEYIEGDEYSVECISFNGEHHFLALTLKYTTGAPSFIETGHLEPAPVSLGTTERIKDIVFHALNSLGIRNGASHSEIKITPAGEIKIIEIGGRMGGDCIGSDLVMVSTGYDFVKMVIQTACGEEPDFSLICQPAAVESRFILTQEDLTEYERIKNNEPERLIKTVDYHPEKIGYTTDSSNRAGCYIVYA